MEDILGESLAFLGVPSVPVDDGKINYGYLQLTVAPKEGKANTLLADHLFSPALFLAERIERGLLTAPRLNVLELGAGAALPSLLLASHAPHPTPSPSAHDDNQHLPPAPPKIVVVTDHPDPVILTNLQSNVSRNLTHVRPGCEVKCVGYAWGNDPLPLLLLPEEKQGYDMIIMSDLLHFDSFHDILLLSVTSLLARTPDARVHVAAGQYTPPRVCTSFMTKALSLGLIFDEIDVSSAEESKWLGKMPVTDLDDESLALRKAKVRYWIGRWKSLS